MKIDRIVFVVALCLLIGTVSALTLDFQISGDATDIIYYAACLSGGGAGSSSSVGTVTWVPSTTGGNSYLDVYALWSSAGAAGTGGWMTIFYNKNAQYSTYASATNLGGYGDGNVYSPAVVFFNSAGDLTYQWHWSSGPNPPLGRWEVIIIDNTAYIKLNGVTQTTTNVSVNPAHIGFGVHTSYTGYCFSHSYWDDYVYGASETGYVIGMPDTYQYDTYWYILRKDSSDSAYNGVARGSNPDDIVSNSNLTVTFSKNNPSAGIMYLRHTGTGEIIGQENVSGYYGTVSWPLKVDLFDKDLSQTPYGSYVAYLNGSTAQLSDSIQFITAGAYVWFNSDLYTYNDPYYIGWSVDGDHWDPATYSYQLRLLDMYGTQKSVSTITTQTGSSFAAGTWPTTYETGVYYIALTETDNSGNVYWLWYDAATLMGYFRFSGWVNDALNATPINVSVVNVSQSSIYDRLTTIDGNYSTVSGFSTGSPITITATAANHETYTFTMTPAAVKTVQRNITLWPTSYNVTGVEMHGTINETIYGRPLTDVMVNVTNVTYGEVHSVMVNNAGAYIIDDTRGGPLTSGRYYMVNLTKLSYSQVYPSSMKKVVGS